MSEKINQRDKVLTLLKDSGAEGISAIEILRYGIYRAASRVAELRAEGWDIETLRTHGQTAVYVLKGKKAPLEPLVPVGGSPTLWASFEAGK